MFYLALVKQEKKIYTKSHSPNGSGLTAGQQQCVDLLWHNKRIVFSVFYQAASAMNLTYFLNLIYF